MTVRGVSAGQAEVGEGRVMTRKMDEFRPKKGEIRNIQEAVEVQSGEKEEVVCYLDFLLQKKRARCCSVKPSSLAECVEDYRFPSDQCNAFLPPAEVSSFRSSHRFAHEVTPASLQPVLVERAARPLSRDKKHAVCNLDPIHAGMVIHPLPPCLDGVNPLTWC